MLRLRIWFGIPIVVLLGGGLLNENKALAADPMPAVSELETTQPSKRVLGLWADLTSDDPGKASRAILALAKTPEETIPFLKSVLRPVKDDPEAVARWIAELDDDQPAVRERAMRELEYQGKAVKHHLEKALEDQPSLETASRIKELMNRLPKPPMPAKAPLALPERINSVSITNGKVKINNVPLEDFVVPPPPPAPLGPPPLWVRAARAIAILEHIDNQEARELLKKLAQGEADAVPTIEAAAALERLKKAEK